MIKDLIKYSIPLILCLILEISFYLLLCSFSIGKGIIFSLIICYVIFGIFFSIANKLSRATIISSITIVLILLINQLKILYVQEPLMFSDLNFTHEINGIINMILPNIFFKIKPYILSFCILIFVLVILIIFTKKNELTFNNKKQRMICLIISTVVFLILLFPTNFLKELILKIVYNTDNYKDYNSYTTNLEYYYYYGFISGIYGTNLNNKINVPQNYDEEQLINELENLNSNINENINLLKPNIIVIFSESFFDIEKIEEVKFDKKITQNFNQLKKEGKSIQLLSPSYGGMSENVTFELLTGGKICYFNKGYIPLTQSNNLENIPSIVKDLKNNGYYSKILFGNDHYNSQKQLEKIGFDEYEEVYDTFKANKYSFRDKVLINKVIEEFEGKSSENPLFYMIETYENHMPYTEDKYDEYNIGVTNSKLNKDDTNTVLSYAQSVYNMDIELKRIYEYIKNYEEPTLILFFGDHLPYLYSKKGDNILNKLEYFNTKDDIENIYRLYNTEALLLSNFEYDFKDIPDLMSVDLLLTYVVNEFNMDTQNYYKWICDNSKNIAAYNSYLKIDNEGKKYLYNENVDKLDNIINLRENMQYMLFVSKK